MTSKSKKLVLGRETLVTLDVDSLAKIAGGGAQANTVAKSCFLEVCTTQTKP
jgi:hypothetical protein